MTKAEARKRAAQHLRCGYFDRGVTQDGHCFAVFCPACRADVTVLMRAWDKEGARIKALKERLSEHLHTNCDQED